MCKLRNYICYSVSIPHDMPFSSIYDRVSHFCNHYVNIGRFQDFILTECCDYVHVFVRGGSKRDWTKEFEDCIIREILLDDFYDVMKVLTESIGEPLLHRKNI